MRPGTYVLLLTSPLNALLNYLLIHTFGLGLLGAPLATGISYWLSFILLSLYAIYFTDSRKHWGGWSVACLKNIGTFARLALLGVIRTCFLLVPSHSSLDLLTFLPFSFEFVSEMLTRKQTSEQNGGPSKSSPSPLAVSAPSPSPLNPS